jgi:hypothetical protein
MTAERDTPLHQMALRWEREASGYERQADGKNDLNDMERRLLRIHARIKRVCATELKDEISKVRRNGA